MVEEAGTPSNAADRTGAEHLDPMLGVPDREIVARIREGDAALFDQCFRAYWEPLCRVVMYIVQDADESRELVAKVFAALWARRERWTVSTTIEAYLFGAARNEARHARRDAVRRSGLLDARINDIATDASLHGTPIESGSGATESTDLALTLDRAVRALPDRYQLAVHLRWRRGMEYAEIGEVLGIGADAARKIVTRALGMLRRQLQEL